MKKYKLKALAFLIVIIPIILFSYKGVKRLCYINNKGKYARVIAETLAWDAEHKTGFEAKKVSFSESGIDNIALITMVKDEEDVIYENLVWHFCVGFRKFVIVDNDSTDKTLALIHKFKKETEGKALVIIIEDPIFEHIQSRIITAAMRTVNVVWPEVEWVFPVDGDEFWYPNRPLDQILADVPKDKDEMLVIQYQQRPCDKYDKIDSSKPFYNSIVCRDRVLSSGGGLGKVAVRSNVTTQIRQGNHEAVVDGWNLSKTSANILGLDMRHFAIRSVDQVYRKYWNGAHANIALKKKGGPSTVGSHWDSFLDEVKDKGMMHASIDRFDRYVAEDKNSVIYDTIDFKKAESFYNKMLGEK